MTTYYAIHVSTQVPVKNEEELEELLGSDEYIIDSNYEMNNGKLKFSDTSTTFDVWDSNQDKNVTREFLNELSKHISGTLKIRSVGHEGTLYLPDAWQWVVEGGEVRKESLE